MLDKIQDVREYYERYGELGMSKIILKDLDEDRTGWFCESCGKQIFGVPETINSKPLLDKCPHCGVTFSDYELCQSRLEMHRKLVGEFPGLAELFNKENNNI